MSVYLDKRTNRLYIEFQYKGTRYKERLPATFTKEDGERLEQRRRRAMKTSGFIYFIRACDNKSFKIGFSIDPEKRFQDLQNSTAIPLELLAVRPGTKDMERGILFHFRHSCIRGEWFHSSNIFNDLYRFNAWNETIQRLDAQLWVDERIGRRRYKLIKRWREFVDTPPVGAG